MPVTLLIYSFPYLNSEGIPNIRAHITDVKLALRKNIISTDGYESEFVSKKNVGARATGVAESDLDPDPVGAGSRHSNDRFPAGACTAEFRATNG